MTRSRSVLCSKIFAGSSLIITMIGVSACTSTPGAQSLAVSSFPHAPATLAYSDEANRPVRAEFVQAEASPQTPQADFMPVGSATMAPSGFLDLCQRSPVDCYHSDTYNPEKIRTLARAATVERYRLAFAALHQNPQIDANANMQSASVAQPANSDAPAAATDSVRYLNWPAQNGTPQGANGPVSYVQPLQHDAAPGTAHGLRPLPGLVAPAVNGLVSDFLDLSVTPGGGWTQLGQVHLTGDAQPGAIADGDTGSATLSWSHKSDVEYAPVVQVSTEATRAPSIQYDIPNEPYDWAHVHVPAAQPASQPPVQASAEPQRAVQADNGRDTADYVRIDMNARNAGIVRAVNDQVNRIMRGATDEQVYHVADYWNAPDLVAGVRGDCEDFALEKRRLLIQNGIPAAAISIAIVRTRLGDEHAVLIVSSWQGDYVLDNLQYDVRPWRKSGYTWISRQGPADDLGWVSLAPANDRTRSPWQARTMRVAYAQ